MDGELKVYPYHFHSHKRTMFFDPAEVQQCNLRFNSNTGQETVQNFRFCYNDPYLAELRNYRLRNDEIISLEVKRRAAFVDYVRVIAPVLTTVATGLLIIDRL